MNRDILKAAGMIQSELADAAGLAEASVSRIVNGLVDPTKDTIDRILAALTKKMGRPVLYEEAFGSPKRKRRVA